MRVEASSSGHGGGDNFMLHLLAHTTLQSLVSGKKKINIKKASPEKISSSRYGRW